MATDNSVPRWLRSRPELGAADAGPAHAAIARWLMEAIEAGEIAPGDRLPSEQQLASFLGVSRMTLRQALGTLGSRGLIERRKGRFGGTFIREPRIECDLTGLAGFTELMKMSNVRAGARIVSAGPMAANATVARSLSLPRDSPVHEIVRVRTARREPLALERSYLPSALFPDLLEHRLTGSLYSLMTRLYGLAPHSAEERLTPVVARPYEADLLTVAVSSPLLQIERTAFTASGMPVEFARDLFRPDRIRISLRTGVREKPELRSRVVLGERSPAR